VTPGFDETEYRRLLTQFPPRPIEGEDDLLRVEARISDLLSQAERTPADEAYLTVLASLFERWERDRVDIPPLSGTELVRALLAERGLRQKDLTPIFGTESITSEVLAGKRELQAKHIARLAAFFHVSPSAFFADPAERLDSVPA
jgi:HTH-type transcriptional regulator/antitoxin HigA